MAKPLFFQKDNCYRLNFYYKKKQYRRYYIKDKKIAEVYQHHVNVIVEGIKKGQITTPPYTKVDDFVFSSVGYKTSFANSFNLSVNSFYTYPAHSFLNLSQLIQRYQENTKPPAKAQSTWETENIHLNHLQNFLKHNNNIPSIANIGVDFFYSYKSYRYKQNVRTDTVNKEFRTFQSMFQLAVDSDYIAENIVAKVKRDKSQSSNDFRTLEQLERLQKSGASVEQLKEIKVVLTCKQMQEVIELAYGKWIQPILVAFANTGMRRGELISLEWTDVDLQQKILAIKSKKQSRSKAVVKRYIPINKTLLAVLEKQNSKKKNKWVFPGPTGKKLSPHTLQGNLKALVGGTKYEKIGFHTFRHSVASSLAGESKTVVKKLLGHTSDAMTEHYQHPYATELEQAMKKLED